MFRKITSLLLYVLLCVSILPTASFAGQYTSIKPGNSDLNILNGGVMLSDGGNFYFVENGIFVQYGETVRPLSNDNGKNLNLYDGYIYYTVGPEIRRVPVNGGAVEHVYMATADIKQLYVVGGTLKYLADGTVYEKSKQGSTAKIISRIPGLTGLIPTQYGDILLTGEAFDYTVWTKEGACFSGVTSCYTDSGYLAVSIHNQNYMVELSKLFNGFDEKTDLLDFNIHGTIALGELLKPDDENTISEDDSNSELQLDFQALSQKAAETGNIRLQAEDAAESATTVLPVSDGQKNIVKRARQLTEIKWTPLEDITQWGQAGAFKAETTYTGIPYGQPINCNGYIGYGVSLETFAAAVTDNTSKLYTTYSSYNKIAPSMSTDCSGFVSYAWGLKNRLTTYSMTNVAEIVSDQSLYSLQVGDCLDKTSSHIILVSGLTYDISGNLVEIQIMEETPVITRVTKYGSGNSKSLSSFQSSYLNNGFAIYRYPQRDSVTYTPSPAVPLDGETVADMKDAVPQSHTTSIVGGKSVSLASDVSGAQIYYTLDGSMPTVTGKKYSDAISVFSTTKLRAIAVSGSFSDSTILEYTVKIPQVSAPTASVTSGLYSDNLVSSGSQVKLASVSGATIYYTADGTEPTASSKVYSLPITVDSDMTIKAIARAKGMSNSQTATFNYKIGPVYTVSASAGIGGSISPTGNSSVFTNGSSLFNITHSDNYAILDVLVDGVSVGAVTSYVFTNVNANHTIAVSFKSTAQLPFTDTDSAAWYYKAVSFAYANTLFNGTSATTFSPDTTMTRGMFVTVLGRCAGLPGGLSSGLGLVTKTGVNIRSGPSTDSETVGSISNKNTVVQVLTKSGNWYYISFGATKGFIRNDLISVYNGNYTDLAFGQYYSPYVEWAYLTGIANNVALATFSAESSITREHMCLLLYNYAVAYGKTLPQVSTKAAFSDNSAISTSAVSAVYALQEAGVVNGMGDGTFSPQGTATRAQVAQIYMKFVNAISQSS